MKTNNLINTVAFSIKYLGATNNTGDRIKITEIKRYSNQKSNSITISYSYEIDNVFEQGLKYLQSIGANVVCYSSTQTEYLIMCNNWGEDYLNLKSK